MATTQSLLTKIDTAIENLLDAIDSDAVQEYTVMGRTYRKADFAKVLDMLFDRRAKLQRQLATETNNPVRVGKLGRARPIDR